MADTSIYVAVIAAGAGIIGAAIPQVSMVLKDARKDKRDWQERQADRARQACVDLVQAAEELRTQIANNLTFQGNREVMGERLEGVRQSATAARYHAANVTLMLPGRLAGPAERLASAAARLADAAVRETDLDLGRMRRDPGFADLAASLAEFLAAAKDHALVMEARPSRKRDPLARVRRRGVVAGEQDR